MNKTLTSDQKQYLKVLREMSPKFDGVVPAGKLMVRLAFGNHRFMEVHDELVHGEYVRINQFGIALHGAKLLDPDQSG